MANNTIWHSIKTIPIGKLVLVYEPFRGYGLRSVTNEDAWYDENEFFDDSGMEWDLWTELPMKPGHRA